MREFGILMIEPDFQIDLRMLCHEPGKPRNQPVRPETGTDGKAEGENGSAKVCHGSGGIVLLRAE
jgi:hypothetical protein